MRIESVELLTERVGDFAPPGTERCEELAGAAVVVVGFLMFAMVVEEEAVGWVGSMSTLIRTEGVGNCSSTSDSSSLLLLLLLPFSSFGTSNVNPYDHRTKFPKIA